MLLLDDIFSELDGRRCHALAACLPMGQALLTSAAPVPDDLPVARAFWVQEGGIFPGMEAIACLSNGGERGAGPAPAGARVATRRR